jgi:predicted glycosyltransferase
MADLGMDERVIVASVGGTAVGRSLLQRVINSYGEARRRVPGLRLIVVAGPHIDPASLRHDSAIQMRGYIPDLCKYLAACNLALVQGGLSTTMELVATGQPFLYAPLRNHFEQSFHVPHQLANYGVRTEARLDFASATPEHLAERIVAAMTQTRSYHPSRLGEPRGRPASSLSSSKNVPLFALTQDAGWKRARPASWNRRV